MPSNARPSVSVILPVYNEQECVESTLRELTSVLSTNFDRWEIVCVDDGSTDETLKRITEFAQAYPDKIKWLSQHHGGQSRALWLGLKNARAETLVTMDADGQNDPADIPLLISKLADADLAIGIRSTRQDQYTKRVFSYLANRFVSFVTGVHVADSCCGIRAMRSSCIEKFLVFDGMHRYFPILARAAGLRLVFSPVNHRSRSGGRTKYTNLGRVFRPTLDCVMLAWLLRRQFDIPADAESQDNCDTFQNAHQSKAAVSTSHAHTAE